jgi:hypothetical protein
VTSERQLSSRLAAQRKAQARRHAVDAGPLHRPVDEPRLHHADGRVLILRPFIVRRSTSAMPRLARRHWVPSASEDYILTLARETAARDADANAAEIDRLIAANCRIHERDCVNLNLATNVMNPEHKGGQRHLLRFAPAPNDGLPPLRAPTCSQGLRPRS